MVEINSMKKYYEFDSEKHHSGTVEELIKKNEYPICSKCKSELRVVLNVEDAKDSREGLGIWCPKNKRHVHIIIDPVTPGSFWDKFDD